MFKPTLQVCLLLASACFFDAHAVEDTCKLRQTDHDFDTVSLLTIKTQLSESPSEDPEVAAQESQDCSKWAPANSCHAGNKPKEGCHVLWKWSTEPKYDLGPTEVVMCRNWPMSCKAQSFLQAIKKCDAPVFTALQSDIVRECRNINEQYEVRRQERRQKLSDINEQFGAHKLPMPEPKDNTLGRSAGQTAAGQFFGDGGACEQATSPADCLERLQQAHTNEEGVSQHALDQLKKEAVPAFQEKEVEKELAMVHLPSDARNHVHNVHLMSGVSRALTKFARMEAAVHFLEFLRVPEDEVRSSKWGLLQKSEMDQGQFDAFKRMLTVYCRAPGQA